MSHPSAEPGVPKVVGSFRVLQRIGEGGMGLIFRAERIGSGERVALKMARHVQPRLLGAIRLEIAALQTVRHPGVVRIVDHGADNGRPWYAMELLEGQTLADLNRRLWGAGTGGDRPSRTTSVSRSESIDNLATTAPGSAAPSNPARPGIGLVPPVHSGNQVAAGRLAEALGLYRSLCAPLAYLHARGIVHRDLKPANLFIREDGTPVLVDFGLISHAAGSGREILIRPSRALGTVSYVSPEQVEGRLVDARADLYSLGCMLYETLCGRPPFSGPNVLERHRSEPPAPPSELVDDVPPALDDLVLQLLAKRPQDRLGYAGDVATALSELLGDEVIPTGAIDATAYLYRPAITGRQELLRTLAERRERVQGGQGALVLLAGESGIGKTFLLSEFAQRSVAQHRFEVVTGECVPVTATSASVSEFTGGALHPLRPLFQIIADRCHANGTATRERLLGRRAPLLAPYEPSLADFIDGKEGLDANLPADAARERLLQCLLETTAALVADTPLLLILDDLQWADDLTLAFLSRLTPSFLQGRALLVLGAYRSDEVSPDLRAMIAGASERIDLGRLDEKAVESIAGDMLAMAAPPARLVGFLTAQSEGNPFFIAEYLRLLVSDGVLRRSGGKWQIPDSAAALRGENAGLAVPRSLQAIVTRRLANLDSASLAVIEAAAEIGREVDLHLLAAVIERRPDQLAAVLREAKNRQVVEQSEERRYRFAHDKLRESAYAQITPARRQDLHRRTALAIEATAASQTRQARHYPDLAHHFSEAGETLKAIEYLEKAGVEALEKSANKEAIAFLTETIDRAQRAGVTVDSLRFANWHLQIGDALQGMGDLDRSAEYLRKAATLLGRPAPEGRFKLVRSLLAGLFRQTLHRLFPRRFLGSRRHQSETLIRAAQAHDRLQRVLYYSGDALAMLHACVASLNASELADDSAELTTAYSNAHAVAGILPARARADDYYRRACETNARVPDAAAESYLRLLAGFYQNGLGNWQRAKDELERGLVIARDVGFRRRWEELNSALSIGQFVEGQFGQALASAELVLQSAIRGDFQTQCWALIEKAQALLAEDQAREATVLALKAQALLQHRLGRTERLWVQAVLCRAHLREGDVARAREAARLALVEIQAGPPVSFAWVDAYSAVPEVFIDLLGRTNDKRERRQLLRQARLACRALNPLARIFPVAEPRRWLWQGRLLWCIGKHRRALACWQRSLAAARRLHMPHDEAEALLSLALSRPRHHPERTRELEAAGQLFERLQAHRGLALARAGLVESHAVPAG